MTDEAKTREQLLEELGAAKVRVSELERNETERRLAEERSLSVGAAAGNLEELAGWGGLPVGGKVEKVALFPRVDAPVTV